VHATLELTAVDEARQKAFDFAQDAAKQLITLSTAVVALTITFFKDFAGVDNDAANVIMAVSWLFYLLSIAAGIVFLFTLTFELEPRLAPPKSNGDAGVNTEQIGREPSPPDDVPHVPTINNESALFAAGAQQLTFGVGLLLSVVAGVVAL
jgi:hypothetical protein